MRAGPRVFASVPIAVATDGELQRADIVVDGLDQAGSSFELRIFVNNPEATAATAPAGEDGYAGSIWVYGYGVPPASLLDESDGAGRLAMTRSVVATDAVRRALAQGPTASLTLVPVAADSPGPEIDLGPVGVAVHVDRH